MQYIYPKDVKGYLLKSEKFIFLNKNYPTENIEYPIGLYREDIIINNVEDLAIFHKISIWWNIDLPIEFYNFLFNNDNMLNIILYLKDYLNNHEYCFYIKCIKNNCKKTEDALIEVYNMAEPIFENIDSQFYNYWRLLKITEDLPIFG